MFFSCFYVFFKSTVLDAKASLKSLSSPDHNLHSYFWKKHHFSNLFIFILFRIPVVFSTTILPLLPPCPLRQHWRQASLRSSVLRPHPQIGRNFHQFLNSLAYESVTCLRMHHPLSTERSLSESCLCFSCFIEKTNASILDGAEAIRLLSPGRGCDCEGEGDDTMEDCDCGRVIICSSRSWLMMFFTSRGADRHFSSRFRVSAFSKNRSGIVSSYRRQWSSHQMRARFLVISKSSWRSHTHIGRKWSYLQLFLNSL